MQETKNIIDRVKLEAYSLAELLGKVQEKLQEGFEVDFITNEGYPTSFGSYLICDVVKYEQEELGEKVVESIKVELTKEVIVEKLQVENTEVKEVKKAGRPKAS